MFVPGSEIGGKTSQPDEGALFPAPIQHTRRVRRRFLGRRWSPSTPKIEIKGNNHRFSRNAQAVSVRYLTYTFSSNTVARADLTIHEDWESVPIVSHAHAGSIDGMFTLTACLFTMKVMHTSYTVPVSVALSPNETLVCCISSPLLGSHFSIQALPRRVSGGTASMLTGNLQGDLSRHLVAAIRARYSPSDVIHALAMPPMSTEAAVNTLYQAFTTMEADSNGLMEVWTAELLGVAAEVYGYVPAN